MSTYDDPINQMVVENLLNTDGYHVSVNLWGVEQGFE